MMNRSSNPYFDPNPTWMFVILKIEFAVGFIASALLIYLLIYQTPPTKSQTFIKLLIFHIIVGCLFGVHFNVLSPPLYYLPYAAIECPGFWTAIGVPVDIQLAEMVHLMSAGTAAVCPLFYYRMDMLLPPNHLLQNRLLRYTVYGSAYILCNILPAPLIYMALNFKDQDTWKREWSEELKIDLAGFWRPEVWAVRMAGNYWAVMNSILTVTAISSSTLIIFTSTYIIYKTIHRATRSISSHARRHHITVLWSLLSLAVVLLTIFMVDIPFLIYALWTNSPRADLMNLVMVIGGSAFPLAVIAYTFSYSPYRQFFLKLATRKVAASLGTTVAAGSSSDPESQRRNSLAAGS